MAVELTVMANKKEFDSFIQVFFLGHEDFSQIRREEIVVWGIEGIVCKFTRPLPNENTLEYIVASYPSLFLKLTWTSPHGASGMYIGREKSLRLFQWNDISQEEEVAFRSH
jgi:hypothetical protein